MSIEPTNAKDAECLASGTARSSAAVAFLGPKFTYSHLAAIAWFGQADFRPLPTIDAVFDAVERGEAIFGVAPLTTSADGDVAETHARLAQARVRRCGELPLAVHHQLLGKCKLGEVREVYSRKQALSQCRTWLDENLPAAKRIETASTAEAARVVQTRPRAAAIASREAGTAYQLDLLAADIEDRRHNITRFVVFQIAPEPRATGE